MIETLLPKSKFARMELYAEEEYKRAGWI